MRLVGLIAAAATVMLILPALAENAGGQRTSGGVFDWLANTFNPSQAADQTLDERKKPAERSGGASEDAEPQPMDTPEDGISDKDSYKPDAGDAPK